jgi:hypothetical protein
MGEPWSGGPERGTWNANDDMADFAAPGGDDLNDFAAPAMGDFAAPGM